MGWPRARRPSSSSLAQVDRAYPAGAANQKKKKWATPTGQAHDHLLLLGPGDNCPLSELNPRANTEETPSESEPDAA